MQTFLSATSFESHATAAADDLLQQLGTVPDEASVGFIYATDHFAAELSRLLEALREQTGITHWIGSVGQGICDSNTEIHDRAAVTIMLADFSAESFLLFNGMEQAPVYDNNNELHVAIVHADPRNGMVTEYIQNLPQKMGNTYLIGGMTSSSNHFYQVADHVTEGDISGIVFKPSVNIVTGLTQGCTPIGDVHTLSECDHHIAMSIDNKPALDVFKQEIGDVLARNIDRAAGYIFAAFPVRGSDTANYLVRDIIGIDTENNFLAIADNMQAGSSIMFCKRDAQSAVADMQRMLDDLKKRVGEQTIRGGIYISCLGRGHHLFGKDNEELRLIHETLGEFPLAGFSASGEIAGDQLYGYTGVLTLFL